MLSLTVFFIDRKVNFLVDNGAKRPIISRSLVPDALLYPFNVVLTGVNRTALKTYGQCSVKLGVRGLRRELQSRSLFLAQYDIEVIIRPSHIDYS